MTRSLIFTTIITLAALATNTDASAMPPDPTNLPSECSSEAHERDAWEAACDDATMDYQLSQQDLAACVMAWSPGADPVHVACAPEYQARDQAEANVLLACGQFNAAQDALIVCIHNANNYP